MDENDEVNAWIEEQYAHKNAMRKDLEAFGVDPMTGGDWSEKGVYPEGHVTYTPDQTALPTILAERHKSHGDYTHQADVCQRLKRIIHSNTGLNKNPLTSTQLDALEMIAMKMSRIVAGDPNHKDSWVDIAGYATLVADRIE